MNPPLIANIPVPLQEMLPAEEFQALMAFSEAEGVSPDVVMIRALRVFVPQMTPPEGAATARAA